MAVKKAAAEGKMAAPAKDAPRELSELVPVIREMRDQGKTVPEICEELEVSYHVVNQIMTQSYKMTMDTLGVFQRQEMMRLGLTADE